MKKIWFSIFICLLVVVNHQVMAQNSRESFNDNWFFKLDTANEYNPQELNNKPWRAITVPHDWSIGLDFDSTSPSGNDGACLRGGTGMYKKTFILSSADKGKNIFIDFDGVYMNSTVWINGHELGNRPNGYISFQYNMTPYLKFNGQQNLLKVLVKNHQPNSRWYSGSGIYRNVWIEKKGSVYVDHWGTYITTPQVSAKEAIIKIQTKLKNSLDMGTHALLKTTFYNQNGSIVKILSKKIIINANEDQTYVQSFSLSNPLLWSTQHPNLYRAISQVFVNDKVQDVYKTNFGVRYFHFDKDSGFYLNGNLLKIIGVCMHHDLGSLGAAINVRAMQRQLQILKSMGINGIRTSHNPPAPEWLDLCDKMGFIVLDEAFDSWELAKTKYDYHLYFKNWHKKDLTDQVVRDRNHPSVFMWSIGNEILEQKTGDKDTSGRNITRNLVQIVKGLDDRPITAAMNESGPNNNISCTGALDLIGINYHHWLWEGLPKQFPGQKFILTETISSLQSRGEYLMPSDSIRHWWGFTREKNGGTPDFTCSAYDNSAANWGSTYEESLKLLLKHPYLSGMYIWTGFDYLGEPTPYPYPARSSYFGIVDMAGFPKDTYYLFKSLFTKDTVLHIFPHWNWNPGQKIDVWAYYNNADEVELFLNGKSLGIRKKTGDDLHVQWNNIVFEPGTLKAVSRKDGKIIKLSTIKTAGEAYKLVASADRSTINADGDDLSFVKITVEDKAGNMVPYADNVLHFSLKGDGEIAALDNGCETDLTPFSNKKWRKAFNGLALAIVKAHHKKGKLTLHISADGLQGTSVDIEMK
ncbi:MAG TPA: glycoside hydrolase family 2 TIM barrel-domain containing protein [Arachidicoccus soli]|nr:glycoside hydrolase family 2 TIM barrel-domain containing protein [Arachidicoccus soli]